MNTPSHSHKRDILGGLTQRRFEVLTTFAEANIAGALAVSARGVAKQMGVWNSTLTAHARQLEACGYLTRIGPKRGRAVRWRVTSRGVAAIATARSQPKEWGAALAPLIPPPTDIKCTRCGHKMRVSFGSSR